MRHAKLRLTGVLVLAGGHASAAGIDLSKPYGDKYGCINRNGQEVARRLVVVDEDGNVMGEVSRCR